MIDTLQLNWQKQELDLAHVDLRFLIYEKETPKEASTDVQKENTILPRGLLEINLGVPTMIVCCNTEVMVLQDLNYYSSRKIKPSQDL